MRSEQRQKDQKLISGIPIKLLRSSREKFPGLSLHLIVFLTCLHSKGWHRGDAGGGFPILFPVSLCRSHSWGSASTTPAPVCPTSSAPGSSMAATVARLTSRTLTFRWWSCEFHPGCQPSMAIFCSLLWLNALSHQATLKVLFQGRQHCYKLCTWRNQGTVGPSCSGTLVSKALPQSRALSCRGADRRQDTCPLFCWLQQTFQRILSGCNGCCQLHFTSILYFIKIKGDEIWEEWEHRTPTSSAKCFLPWGLPQCKLKSGRWSWLAPLHLPKCLQEWSQQEEVAVATWAPFWEAEERWLQSSRYLPLHSPSCCLQNERWSLAAFTRNSFQGRGDFWQCQAIPFSYFAGQRGEWKAYFCTFHLCRKKQKESQRSRNFPLWESELFDWQPNFSFFPSQHKPKASAVPLWPPSCAGSCAVPSAQICFVIDARQFLLWLSVFHIFPPGSSSESWWWMS